MAERALQILEDTTDAAMAKADDAKGAVKRLAVEASDFGREVRSAATGHLSRGARHAGSRAKATAEGFHSVEDTLRRHGQERAADIASHAVDRLESVGSRLENVGRASKWSRFKGFMKPWLLVAGGVLVAIAASRLLKSVRGRDTRR